MQRALPILSLIKLNQHAHSVAFLYIFLANINVCAEGLRRGLSTFAGKFAGALDGPGKRMSNANESITL